jgi:polysaccharide biosynthesis/export protein
MRVLLLSILLLLLPVFPATAVTPKIMSPTVSSGPYVIGAGDSIRIEVFDEPTLSQTILVPDSGVINFPLVGDLSVIGLYPDEVAGRLKQSLGEKYLVNPQVSVKVDVFGSRPVQVLGAVKNPGLFHLTGPTTVLEMLAIAGGVDAEKSSKEVHITRQVGNDSTHIVVNLERLLETGEGNLPLEKGDVLYVPQGALVYISGQVTKPGPVLYYDGLTVSQALISAGGPTPTAKLREAYVLRNGKRMPLNIRRIMRGADTDLPLQPGDQVFVEQSVF